jgi:hypothetical protein
MEQKRRPHGHDRVPDASASGDEEQVGQNNTM